MKMTNHKQDPLNPFMVAVQDINVLLRTLKAHCDNHFDTDPDAINWADVGNVKHIKNLLQEVLDFVEGRE